MPRCRRALFRCESHRLPPSVLLQSPASDERASLRIHSHHTSWSTQMMPGHTPSQPGVSFGWGYPESSVSIASTQASPSQLTFPFAPNEGAQHTLTSVESPPYSPRYRSFVINDSPCAFVSAYCMRTEGTLDKELDEWLEQEDTADSRPQKVYEQFKREVQAWRSSRRRGLVQSVTTIYRTRRGSRALEQSFRSRYVSKEAVARDDRVWHEMSDIFAQSVDDHFSQSNVQPGGVTEFVYGVIAAHYNRSCISRSRHIDKVGKLVRPVIKASRSWASSDSYGR